MNRHRPALRVWPWLVALVGCGSQPAAHAPNPDASADAARLDAAIDAGSSESVPLPSGMPGIGFDDLRFSPRTHTVVVPAGRTGAVDLVDDTTRAVASIDGFTKLDTYDGTHDTGATSADDASGYLLVVDRTASKLHVVDPSARQIVSSTAIPSAADYVRFVATTHEAWITLRAAQRIHIFTLAQSGAPSPTGAAFIPIAGAPESLVVDATRGRVYTNVGGSTLALDVKGRAVVGTWSNGCGESRGIALDEARGIVFVACTDGTLALLDVQSGAVTASMRLDANVDIIDYNATLRHVYVPSATTGSMAIVGVHDAATIALLGTAAIPTGAHCVVADDGSRAWVCDPAHGQLVVIADSIAATQ
jgi:hypothetical protein